MNKTKKKRGSVASGLIGALLGALIGAVLWALVGIAGYIASIVGFVIAFLAGKGYDLFHGRKGTAKIVVLILCVILAVAAGNIGSYAWQIHDVYQEEVSALSAEEQAYVVSEGEFFQLMAEDSEVQVGFLKDFAMGAVFAALGCFGVIRDANKPKKKKSAVQKAEPAEESDPQ